MIVIQLLIIIICSIVIWKVGDKFAEASSNIGDYLRLPRSVKGATFDAVASSFPELMVAIFSVISFKQFEVGIGTIAGSAMFNLLIIPGIAVLVAPKAFKVSKEIFSRDALFYLIAVFALVSALAYSNIWGLTIPIIFILIYLWYVKDIISDTKEHKEMLKNKELFLAPTATANGIKKAKKKEIKLGRNILIGLGSMIIMGLATYFLTEQAILFAGAIGIHPIIISFTIIAAATSIPDAAVSIINAKKGDLDDSISNVFGSNIFDILIGLSIPILMAYFISGPVNMNFEYMGVLFLLFASTIISMYFLRNHEIAKKQGVIMIIMYLLFLAYIIRLAIIG